MFKMLPLTQRIMLLSIAAALLTIALKFGAWLLTGSVGLFSDAAESVVNLLAASFALLALRVAATPPDDGHMFGHDKAEYFSSALEGTLILVAAGAIIYAAVERLLNPQPIGDLGWGLLISIVASAVNAGVALLMMRVAHREDSIVLEADAHHLLTDVWTSLGVVGGLLLVLLWPQAQWLDPVIAILVALNILRTAWELLRRSFAGLMDAALPPPETALLQKILGKVLSGQPAELGRLRTRKAGSRRFIDFDVYMPAQWTVQQSHELCDVLEAAIHAEFSKADISIHVEPLHP